MLLRHAVQQLQLDRRREVLCDGLPAVGTHHDSRADLQWPRSSMPVSGVWYPSTPGGSCFDTLKTFLILVLSEQMSMKNTPREMYCQRLSGYHPGNCQKRQMNLISIPSTLGDYAIKTPFSLSLSGKQSCLDLWDVFVCPLQQCVHIMLQRNNMTCNPEKNLTTCMSKKILRRGLPRKTSVRFALWGGGLL